MTDGDRIIYFRDQTGEQYYFANLDDLIMFLLQEMEKPAQGELLMG